MFCVISENLPSLSLLDTVSLFIEHIQLTQFVVARLGISVHEHVLLTRVEVDRLSISVHEHIKVESIEKNRQATCRWIWRSCSLSFHLKPFGTYIKWLYFNFLVHVLNDYIWSFLVHVLNDYHIMQCHAVIWIISLCCSYSNCTERSLGWRWMQPDWKKTLPRTVTGTSHLVSICPSVHPVIGNNLNYFLSTTH